MKNNNLKKAIIKFSYVCCLISYDIRGYFKPISNVIKFEAKITCMIPLLKKDIETIWKCRNLSDCRTSFKRK